MATNIAKISFQTVVQLFFPYQYLDTPVNSILNAPSEKQAELVNKWTQTTLFELNFIGIVVRRSIHRRI